MSKVSNTFETRSTYIVTDCLVSKLPKDFEELLKRIEEKLLAGYGGVGLTRSKVSL